MNIKEFEVILKAEIAEFRNEFDTHDDYPTDLELSDWYDQYVAFLQVRGSIEC